MKTQNLNSEKKSETHVNVKLHGETEALFKELTSAGASKSWLVQESLRAELPRLKAIWLQRLEENRQKLAKSDQEARQTPAPEQSLLSVREPRANSAPKNK